LGQDKILCAPETHSLNQVWLRKGIFLKKSHISSKYIEAFIWILALPVLFFLSRYNYNLFHSIADGISIAIAVCVFMIIWNSRRFLDNNYFLFTGIAFLFFAFLDLMHVLGNKEMGVFPEFGNLGPTLYIASRYLLSISLLIAPLFINRKLNVSLTLAGYSVVTLLVLLSILDWNIFPVCIVEGVGLTSFKVVSDYITCLILLGAIGMLLVNRRSFDSRVLRLIVSSLVLSIATGLTFTLYTDPFGITNTLGHFFQIGSFYLAYLAFIDTSINKPQMILYRKLKQHEEQLDENIRQLDLANIELKNEIAERKQAERDLKMRSKQLEEANKELESFSYSVSHDLRAPLRAIDGFSEMLQRDLENVLDEESRRKLKVVRENTGKMNHLIDDLLNLSRLGRQALNPSILDMNKIFIEAWEDLCQSTPERNVSFRLEELSKAIGDRNLVKQVVLNILSNAIKYTRDRNPAVIEVGSSNGDGSIVFSVKDNGAGFDMKYYEKLFGVFQRLHSQREYKGTGVGLAIVQRIIHRHGGRVWAEANVGKGATFYFSLQSAEEPNEISISPRSRYYP
jgi:signal transduction histidine kinase